MSRTYQLIDKVERALARLDVNADNLHERIPDDRIAAAIIRNCSLPESPKGTIVPDASQYLPRRGAHSVASGGSRASKASAGAPAAKRSEAAAAAKAAANGIALHRLKELEAELAKARSTRQTLEETLRSLSDASHRSELDHSTHRITASKPATATAITLDATMTSSKRMTIPRAVTTPVKAGMSWNQHMVFTVDLPSKMQLRNY